MSEITQYSQPTAEEAQLWANALRSKKYKQGVGALDEITGLPDGTIDHHYCCLGVACIITIPDELLSKYDRDSNRVRIGGAYPNSQDNAPNWLKEINQDFQLKSGVSFATINDSPFLYFNEQGDLIEGKADLKADESKFYLERFTFDEIADLIELVYVHKILDESNPVEQ